MNKRKTALCRKVPFFVNIAQKIGIKICNYKTTCAIKITFCSNLLSLLLKICYNAEKQKK